MTNGRFPRSGANSNVLRTIAFGVVPTAVSFATKRAIAFGSDFISQFQDSPNKNVKREVRAPTRKIRGHRTLRISRVFKKIKRHGKKKKKRKTKKRT